MERKMLLPSPHLKVQNTPYIVRSIFDGLMYKQLLQGDNTHLSDTGTFPSVITRQGGALLCNVVNVPVFVTNRIQERGGFRGLTCSKLALIFKWEIISNFQ